MKKTDILLGVVFLLGFAYITYLKTHEPIQAPVPEKQPPMVCYSPFDVYVTYDYELPDESTLITSHGRVYKSDECRLYEEGI